MLLFFLSLLKNIKKNKKLTILVSTTGTGLFWYVLLFINSNFALIYKINIK